MIGGKGVVILCGLDKQTEEKECQEQLGASSSSSRG